jgi:hypothetical protein
MSEGYLYVFYNESFVKSYGEGVYKLGRTKNLKNRISTYNTSFIKDSEYVLTSRLFKNSIKAENVLFFLLRKFRIRDKREFFKIELDELKKYFIRVNNFSDNIIEYIYKKINSVIFDKNFINKLECLDINTNNVFEIVKDENNTRDVTFEPEDFTYLTDEEWSESIEKKEIELNNFFEKFRYISKK